MKIYLSSVARFCIEYALISQTIFSLLPSVTGARKTSPILSLQVETYLYSLPIRKGFLHVKKYIDLAHSNNNNMTAKNLKIGICSRQETPPNSFKARSLNWATIL